MRHFVSCLLLAILLMPMRAGAQVEHDFANVVLSLDGEDLLVSIDLNRETRSLALTQADVERADAITVETPGLNLADNVISGDRAFNQVTLRLSEDLTERDARYPAYYRVGDGRLLYAPAIYPDHSRWDVFLGFADIPDGWTRWPDAPLPQGYLFLGPESMVVEQGGVRFVFDGNGDEAFEAEIREIVGSSINLLTQTFGMPPDHPPFVATSVIASEHSSTTGDVTSDAIIALRFHGGTLDPTSRGALGATRSLILHEGVHFWNGGVARFAQGTPMWLHEGGAEYIAMLSSWRLGWSDLEQVQGTFANWLERCRTTLGWSDDAALNDISFIPASMRYSCGPLLHLLVELYQGEGEPGPGVVQMWRETVGNAVADNTGEYTLADWVATSGDAGLLDQPALAAILATSGAERWAVVDAELARLGVEVSEASSPPLRARTALMFLIRSQCTQLQPGEGYGFYSGAISYQLDTPEGCGLLAGDPVIATLGGHPITAMTAEDYAGLQAICAERGTIAFGREYGDPIDVPCPGDLPDPNTQPTITGLPDIPAFR